MCLQKSFLHGSLHEERCEIRQGRPAFPLHGYVLLSELARLWVVDPATICRRHRAQGLSHYAHPSDQRPRLVREDDIRAIFGISRAA